MKPMVLGSSESMRYFHKNIEYLLSNETCGKHQYHHTVLQCSKWSQSILTELVINIVSMTVFRKVCQLYSAHSFNYIN